MPDCAKHRPLIIFNITDVMTPGKPAHRRFDPVELGHLAVQSEITVEVLAMSPKSASGKRTRLRDENAGRGVDRTMIDAPISSGPAALFCRRFAFLCPALFHQVRESL